ncbi:unnamed protein product [Victoria cruziana]
MNPPLPPHSNHHDLGRETQTPLGLDFMCLGAPNLQYHQDDPADLSRPAPEFHEFQLFPHDDAPSLLFHSTWQSGLDQAAVEPAEQPPLPRSRGGSDNLPGSSFFRRLTLDGCCTTASSSASQPMEFPLQGQQASGCSSSTTTVTTEGSDARNTSEAISATEREARVSRYREKRKRRHFAKTIRYASRKAYAETRPRVKGRFVKSAEAEAVPPPQHYSRFGMEWFHP